jgi:hypothetical protein
MNVEKKHLLSSSPKTIKFSDTAIEKFNLTEDDFAYTNQIEQKIKFKKQIYVPFSVDKNTHLKGLKLCVFKNTNTKSFIVQYWYNQKPKLYVLGKFIPIHDQLITHEGQSAVSGEGGFMQREKKLNTQIMHSSSIMKLKC